MFGDWVGAVLIVSKIWQILLDMNNEFSVQLKNKNWSYVLYSLCAENVMQCNAYVTQRLCNNVFHEKPCK